MAPEVGVLELVARSELHEAIQRAMTKLKSRERKAIEMWMKGMSVRAIANELSTTVGAVKMLKFRTLLKLREILRDCCDAY